MRIFLTGATGYIGTALSRRLAADGHELRALVRPTSRTATLEELGVACFRGDVTDRYSMREGMSGADWVIHAAADLDPGAPPGRMHRINVEGSENVASLAYKLGVGRLLSVSSIAYFGGSPTDGTPGDENAPVQRPFTTRYSATKHAGEEAIRAWEEKGLRLNTVYPSLVYGPPGKKQGANTLLYLVLKGRMPALVGGDRRTSWVFLDDLVDGMVRILERAEPGRAYLMAGDGATLESVVRRVCELGGRRPPRLRLPLAAARLLAAVSAPYYRLRGRRPPLTAQQLGHLRHHWLFDDARARSELDWHPRPLAEGLPPTVEHLEASW